MRERALFLREQDGAVLNTPFRSASKFRSIMKKGRRKSAPPPEKLHISSVYNKQPHNQTLADICREPCYRQAARGPAG